MRKPAPTDFLTTAQVASHLGVSIATVNRWAKSGRLPVAAKVPGRTGPNLYLAEDVQALKEAAA